MFLWISHLSCESRVTPRYLMDLAIVTGLSSMFKGVVIVGVDFLELKIIIWVFVGLKIRLQDLPHVTNIFSVVWRCLTEVSTL